MKRKKYASMIKILFSCLVVAMTCFAFACSTKNPGETEKETNADFTDATEWSFESLDEIYGCFSFASAFGRVSLNSDAQYVTKGERSLKIESIGTYNPSLTDPSMCIRLADISSTGVYDFSKIKSVSFDIFNMNEESQTLSVNFTSDGRTTNATSVTVDFAGDAVSIIFDDEDGTVFKGKWKKGGESMGTSMIEYTFDGGDATFGTCGRVEEQDGTRHLALYVVHGNTTYYFTAPV